MSTYWKGTAPTRCATCDTPLVTVFADMRIVRGPWGCLCPTCVARFGMGYGVGLGQEYTRQPDGRWLKTKG